MSRKATVVVVSIPEWLPSIYPIKKGEEPKGLNAHVTMKVVERVQGQWQNTPTYVYVNVPSANEELFDKWQPFIQVGNILEVVMFNEKTVSPFDSPTLIKQHLLGDKLEAPKVQS